LSNLSNSQNNERKAIVLVDGYPRDYENYDYFLKHSPNAPNAPNAMNVSGVIYMSCKDGIMLERACKRNSEVETHRIDSDLATIKRRIRAFHNVTVPVIALFPNSVVTKIDCSDTLENTFDSVKYLFD
jgi:adenylate kinase family enzyme